jgi:hypothetical protein
MAGRERGARNVLRGVVTAVVVVAAIVLLTVYFGRIRHAVVRAYHFVANNVPSDGDQRTAVLVYLILAVIAAVAFSRAGHFMAYGLAIGLGSLLWFLFWEGFPPLKLHPTWTNQMALHHLGRTPVIVWAVVAVVLITLVFVPLEIGEKGRRRRRDLLPDTG